MTIHPIPLNFGLLGVAWTAQTVRQVVDLLEATLLPGAWPNYVLGNHDEPRIISRVGPAQARLAMLLLLTVRGTPTLYYGDEIGMHDGDIPPERIYDPMEKNKPGQGLGRDPERSPMQWDSSPHAGFCPSAVEPWLPIPADSLQFNVAVEREDAHSMLTLTRKVLEIRRTAAALSEGSYCPVEDVPEDCFVYLRQCENQRYLIALNFSNHAQTVRLAAFGAGQLILSTHLDRLGQIDLTAVGLRGDEGCLIELIEACAG